LSFGNFDEIDVPQSLQKLKITRMGRENQKFFIQYEFQANDGQSIPVLVNFDIKPEFRDTLEEFNKKAKTRLQLTPETIQRTMVALANDEYCRRILQFYDRDVNNSCTGSSVAEIGVGEPPPNQSNTITEEQEEVYASSASDPDYTDEGLRLLSVSSAIRRNPGPIRVTGIIDTVRQPFKLITKMHFTCTNRDCRRQDISQPYILDRPIFSQADMPIAFAGGVEEYSRYLRCPSCREHRELRPDMNEFANAKVIELRNINTGKVPLISVNTTLNMEHLAVIVFGKHTLSVGLGEEVEIVGDLYVLASGLALSRFGHGSSGAANIRTAGDGGRAQPIVYARRVKYTKRQRELELTSMDVEIIKRLASSPKSKPKGADLVSVLTNLLCPKIYDKTGVAKQAILVTAVGAAPIHTKENFYGDRYWINTILAGDKGNGKTTLMEDGVNLRRGSQIISAQHSTGKGSVAIAEREGGVGGAILRAGAATLAHESICGIDEFQLFEFESQDQFLGLMQNGYFDFNKMGIKQRITAHTSFITTANPSGGRWKDSKSISLGEVLIKEQLWDRQDFFAIFKDDETDEQREEFSIKKIQLSKICIRSGYQLLQKYIHYIQTNPELQETKFSDPDEVERLRIFWIMIAKTYRDVMGNRSFETVFRAASTFARLMLKTSIDSEVVDETIKFLTRMYRQLGDLIVENVDPRATAYGAICRVVKKYSQDQDWVEQNKPEGKQLKDISFNQAAEIATREDENVHKYMGDNFRSSSNRAARQLRKMFYERQNEDYDGGKIKITSKDIHAELTLKWIPNSSSSSASTPVADYDKRE
jgi:DNA replicative helicase MCM subunit Mcm2 (Cdc46/Mcm family)